MRFVEHYLLIGAKTLMLNAINNIPSRLLATNATREHIYCIEYSNSNHIRNIYIIHADSLSYESSFPVPHLCWSCGSIIARCIWWTESIQQTPHTLIAITYLIDTHRCKSLALNCSSVCVCLRACLRNYLIECARQVDAVSTVSVRMNRCALYRWWWMFFTTGATNSYRRFRCESTLAN